MHRRDRTIRHCIELLPVAVEEVHATLAALLIVISFLVLLLYQLPQGVVFLSIRVLVGRRIYVHIVPI